ncbi:MAG: hypothetical protein H0T85_04595 [Geodermatophilaceae bacterium]|nr:hypothetical protein [Geodermatophilaceae bacterium]
MARPLSGAVAGILAGMAGATALNAVTYADQAIRARPAGDTPGQTVNALADTAGVSVPGGAEERQNRLEGLGPLSGLAVGIGVGALSGLLRGFSVKVPKVVAATVVGLGAMAISDTAMTLLKISDPRTWTVRSVVADAVPHLAYGAVTVATLHRLLDPQTPHVR